MTDTRPARSFDGTFPHHWHAEILPSRPLILPTRHFVYPREAEEIERGALEILIHPVTEPAKESIPKRSPGAPGLDFETWESKSPPPAPAVEQPYPEQQEVLVHDFSRALNAPASTGALAPEPGAPGLDLETWENAQPFLATCALGFRDPAVPTGLWSTPNPYEICAVSGGYAYIIDTITPSRFTMIPYRPVLEVRAVPTDNLLLFVGHHSILAWGASGQAWQSEKLSDEGITITAIKAAQLHGQGWSMMPDKEIPFTLDLQTGHVISPARS